jgi:heterodisulfide reductase subunit C
MEPLDLKKLDPDFKHRVAAELGGEHIRKCYACGVCSARCPIEKIEPEYNPRKIIRMILLGLEEDLLREELLWHCSNCYTCQESCPQNVNFTEVVFALRNLAGRMYEVGEFENEKRGELGLPKVKMDRESIRKILED